MPFFERFFVIWSPIELKAKLLGFLDVAIFILVVRYDSIKISKLKFEVKINIKLAKFFS